MDDDEDDKYIYEEDTRDTADDDITKAIAEAAEAYEDENVEPEPDITEEEEEEESEGETDIEEPKIARGSKRASAASKRLNFDYDPDFNYQELKPKLVRCYNHIIQMLYNRGYGKVEIYNSNFIMAQNLDRKPSGSKHRLYVFILNSINAMDFSIVEADKYLEVDIVLKKYKVDAKYKKIINTICAKRGAIIRVHELQWFELDRFDRLVNGKCLIVYKVPCNIFVETDKDVLNNLVECYGGTQIEGNRNIAIIKTKDPIAKYLGLLANDVIYIDNDDQQYYRICTYSPWSI